MGMTWRFTMPYLSTLAALVIIVHSAEENLDPGFRRDLRPRALDPGTSYEEPWKAIDEPVAQQSTRTDVWNAESVEEPRRRPVRKRKRRPQISTEEIESLERHREEPARSYHDAEYDSYQTTESTRRRRKRPEVRPHRWADEALEAERPLKRRGLRRKRPTLDNKPPINEFDEWHHREYKAQPIDVPNKQHDSYLGTDAVSEHVGYVDERYRDRPKSHDSDELVFDESKHGNNNPQREYAIKEDFNGFENSESLHEQIKYTPIGSLNEEHDNYARNDSVTDNESIEYKVPKQSKYLSEVNPIDKNPTGTNNDIRRRNKDKGNKPIDPITLKQLLKKSNGTSLSEILQQHNLSLTDLLHGRGKALSAVNMAHIDNSQSNIKESQSKKTRTPHSETEDISLKLSGEITTTTEDIEATEPTLRNDDTKEQLRNNLRDNLDNKENSTPRMIPRRRFPTGIRRKLRMRPMLNSTLKAQLSRDLMALNARKYSNHNKNLSKSREWKEIIPVMLNRSTPAPDDDTTNVEESEMLPSTTVASIETTISDLKIENTTFSTSYSQQNTTTEDETKTENGNIETTTTSITIEILPSEIISETEKPKVTPIVRPVGNNSVLRRQAFNNRLKRKRMKQKSSTTENPNDDLMKNLYGMGNLVSASEFIERTRRPQTTVTQENTEYVTELEDFMTTQSPDEDDEKVKSTRTTTTRYMSPAITKLQTYASSTEETAKFEIEEILNDTMTSKRLSKILRERNMTLNELVKHRERGSSHVHLADIFHNASKEPNPPEPFLSKSSIEPISKEIYPLRAILEANTHDSTAKPTLDSNAIQENVPVVMDFGNNVNENAENMGIMSLFNKFTGSDISIDDTSVQKDSEGTLYITSVTSVNATNLNDTARESRVLNKNEDMVNWGEIFTFMKDQHKNESKNDYERMIETLPVDKNKVSLEDLDSDGLILMEDLQHLKDFDSNIASTSDEKLEVNTYERSEVMSDKSGILDKIPSNTKSVTIATASILGLAMILFLLTYIAIKWKQQRKIRRKESLCDERIPTPVFENRKGHKNNCSSRSISPMISNSNIYTMSTLDSHNGKESPDYMWNSLRKPFQ